MTAFACASVIKNEQWTIKNRKNQSLLTVSDEGVNICRIPNADILRPVEENAGRTGRLKRHSWSRVLNAGSLRCRIVCA